MMGWPQREKPAKSQINARASTTHNNHTHQQGQQVSLVGPDRYNPRKILREKLDMALVTKPALLSCSTKTGFGTFSHIRLNNFYIYK